MKKLISVLLCVLMMFSAVSVSVSAAEENDFVFAVANDLHYSSTGSAANYKGSYTTDYQNALSTGQLRLENELIIDELLARIAASDCEAILIPGDITDNGTETEHEYIAQKFLAFEISTGKQIYVVPGNHDYMQHRGGKADAQYIKANYAAFGYADAIAVDSATASYVAELNDEYRLLAIDATKPGGDERMTQELYNWIEAQVIKAQQDGKKLMAMSHYNLLQHLVLVETLHPNSILTAEYNIPELFAKYNVKYHFTGHTHDHDVAEYTGSNGVKIYDIVTACLNAYPCPYRVVTMGEKVKVETKFIDKIDTSSLKGKITDTTYTLATENFTEYTKNMMTIGLEKVIIEYLRATKVKSMLGITEENNPELCALVDKLLPRFLEVIEIPLYAKDETVSGQSMESIIAKYNLTIPESEYVNFLDFAVDIYLAHLVGDENNGILSENFAILSACLTGTLNYLLEDVTADEYAMFMSMACELLGADIPVDFFKYAATGLKKAQGIEIFVTAVASPLFLEFTTDIDPQDNNVTLDGYSAKAEQVVELTFWDKIVQFFKDFFAYIMRIFSMGM